MKSDKVLSAQGKVNLSKLIFSYFHDIFSVFLLGLLLPNNFRKKIYVFIIESKMCEEGNALRLKVDIPDAQYFLKIIWPNKAVS